MTVIYQGPSLLDGAPIIAVVTSRSTNAKTGPMLQSWILREDIPPAEAVKSGADYSVCGACVHRGGSCYVAIHRAPSSVWKTYQRGRYTFAASPEALTSLGFGHRVRVGSYGDPAAVPARIWEALLSRADGWTGYTHQWRSALALQPYTMASVDSEAEREEARALGWRTFRVRARGAARLKGEAACPASEEAGHKLTCAQCLACRGAGPRGDVTIEVHGTRRHLKAFHAIAA